MPGPLYLEVSYYQNANEWKWTYFDFSHARLGDHSVRVDTGDPRGKAFAGPLAHALHEGEGDRSEQFAELGVWILERVFGPLARALAAYAEQGGGPIYVDAPSPSLPLAFRPFELARFGATNHLVRGRTFAEAGLHFVWRFGVGAPARPVLTSPRPLCILAALSSGAGDATRDWTRQRREVEQMVRLLLGSGRPVTLQIIHEGLALDAEPMAIQPGERWDIVYRSGQWLQGEQLQAAEALPGEWSAPVEEGRLPELLSQERLWQAVMPQARQLLLPRREHTTFLLDQALHRDDTPPALAFAMPLLRDLLRESRGTVGDWVHSTLIASRLAEGSELPEMQRAHDLMTRAGEHDDHVTVSCLLGGLSAQLLDTDPLAALAIAEQMARYTQRIGLGPWRRIADAQYRLLALNALGRYREVLEEVEALRLRMEASAPQERAEAEVDPRQVREGILDVGRQAAVLSEAWSTALDLSRAVVDSRVARGVSALQLARSRFDDYNPLLHLGRHEEAKQLLEHCLEAFDEANNSELVGMADCALAEVADAVGDLTRAVQYQAGALECAYATGRPEECALSHAALAKYSKHLSTEPTAALSHDLAAAVIWHQLGSDGFVGSFRILAGYDWRGRWPRFPEVVATVEMTRGVQFGRLFGRLPRRAEDGDAALVAVLERVLEARLGERRAKWRQSWLRRTSRK